MQLEVVAKHVREEGEQSASFCRTSLESLPPKELEAVVNREVQEFDAFFQTLGDNAPLCGPELAIIKTYLWWKTHPTQCSTPAVEDTDAQEERS